MLNPTPSQTPLMRIDSFLRENSNAIVVFCLLVFMGVISRFLMVEEPNFKPIGAIILFASFYFGRASIGVVAMFAVMLISDLALGFYEPLMMAAVYGSLSICAALGWWFSRTSDRLEVGLRTFATFVVEPGWLRSRETIRLRKLGSIRTREVLSQRRKRKQAAQGLMKSKKTGQSRFNRS